MMMFHLQMLLDVARLRSLDPFDDGIHYAFSLSVFERLSIDCRVSDTC